MNDVLGPSNWACTIAPAEHWVKCALTIHLPDGRTITREALGGYPAMPDEEDRVKGGDSDAFKRACVLFGIGEYLYGDEPAEPAEPRPPSHRPVRSAEPPTPTSNGNGRGEPRNVPRDRISFSNGRSFYGWLKDNGYLLMAEEIGNREFYPPKFVDWNPAQIDAATVEILDRTGAHR